MRQGHTQRAMVRGKKLEKKRPSEREGRGKGEGKKDALPYTESKGPPASTGERFAIGDGEEVGTAGKGREKEHR